MHLSFPNALHHPIPPNVHSPNDPDALIVSLPCTRPDTFHEEGAAVAYGFNNLLDIFPQTSTVTQPLPISRLTDVIGPWQDWSKCFLPFSYIPSPPQHIYTPNTSHRT
ncbi:hypothetical protein BDR05DRAFT_956413 [Suillus weaverae]|nr:hypothetical protein BDR05DRAFT_956413 [Suillus weaverae]